MYNFGVGCEKGILVSGTTRQVRIIGFNHDDAVDTAAGDKIGITFQFTALLPPTRPMNTTQNISTPGTWSNMTLRTTLNGTAFINTFPTDLRAVIRPAVKLSIHLNRSAVSSNETVWILCDAEYRPSPSVYVSGSATTLLTGEVYEFWTTNNATILAPSVTIFTRVVISATEAQGIDSRWGRGAVSPAHTHGIVPAFGV